MAALLSGSVTECSLDHDLGLQDQDPDEYMRLLREDPDEAHERIFLPNYKPEENGLNLVRWMCEQNVIPGKVTVHSWNPDGARQMAALLNDHGHDCILDPYNETTLERNAVTDFDETAWWGSCANTFHEETKQLIYAARMGLLARWNGAHPPTFNIGGRSVIDIGGGPVSLLLKCVNFPWATVVDPGKWPDWVIARYTAAGIGYRQEEAEELSVISADEAWIYNCLTHVRDPEKIIASARKCAKTIRIFEWVDNEPYPGHPHKLTKSGLEKWLGAAGFVTELNESGCVGRAFYGVFAGSH